MPPSDISETLGSTMLTAPLVILVVAASHKPRTPGSPWRSAANASTTAKTEARAVLSESLGGVISLLSFRPAFFGVVFFFFDPKRPRGQMLPYAPFAKLS